MELEIKCEVSGRPLTRSTEYGMFCDSDNCYCEKESERETKDWSLVFKEFFGIDY